MPQRQTAGAPSGASTSERTTPDAGLSLALCQQLLRANGFPSAVVLDLRPQALAVSGAVADMTRLHITYAEPESGPASVIVKSRAVGGQRLLMDQAMGLHTREAWFYSQWRDRVTLRSPRWFGVADTARAPMLLEDLGHLRPGDQVAGLQLADAGALMDALANQHATSWQSADCAERRLARATDANYTAMVAHLVQSGVDTLATRYADRAPAAAIDAVRKLAPRWGEVISACAAGPQTIAHNDCRLDNVFFAADGAPIFIDWQAIGATRGTHDVANLLAGSMDIDALGTHWEQLLRRYHRRLIEHGVTDYPWDDCLLHYRQSVLFPLGQGIALVGALDRHDDRGLTDPAALRPLLHCHDLDSFSTV